VAWLFTNVTLSQPATRVVEFPWCSVTVPVTPAALAVILMVVVFPTVTELLSIESEIVVVPLLITTTAGKCVVTPFESVTRTVRLYVPTGVVEATVIVSTTPC
jgi:hypothetical protein